MKYQIRANPCLLGPSGTGKTHLLIGLGHAALEAGHRRRAGRDALPRARRQLCGQAHRHLHRLDFVVVDEIGFAPLDPTGSQLFFRFFAAAYERVSLGIGSDWPFEDWGRFLPEHTSTVSMLDRLIHHAVVVVTQGESFRMREVRSRGGGLPSA